MRLGFALLLALASAPFATSAASQSVPTLTETVRFIPTPDSASHAGRNVAIDGDHVIATDFHDRWSVHSYRRGTDGVWRRGNDLEKVQPQSSNFGETIALDGRTAFVVDPNAGGGELRDGAAFVYHFEAADGEAGRWVLVDTLGGVPGVGGFATRYAVLDGDAALVSALIPATDSEAGWGGSFVYERTAGEWEEVARVAVPSGGVEVGGFGYVAALAGRTALLGNRATRTDSIQSAGAAYLVRQGEGGEGADGAWAFDTTLTAPVPHENDNFGASVALADSLGPGREQTVALVGTTGEDFERANEGGVHVWRRDSGDDARWVYEGVLAAPDRIPGARFGHNVDVAARPDGSVVAVVGAPWDDRLGLDRAGSAYVFVRSTAGVWEVRAKLAPSDSYVVSSFAGTTSVSADASGEVWVAVGYPARRHPKTGATDSGGVYLYEVSALAVDADDGPDDDTGDFALSVAPNPMSGSARVRYTVAAPGTVRVSVHDALGRRVAVLAEGPHGAGDHGVALEASRWAAGVYVVRVETEAGAETRRVVVAR